MKALWMEYRNIKRGNREVRAFGRLMAVVSVLIGILLGWKSGWQFTTSISWILGIGAIVFLGGTFFPAVVRPIYHAWMGIALVMGFVTTRVLLTLVFFLVITPIAFVFRVLGKDPLHRNPNADLPSYWIRRSEEAPMSERMTRYY